MQSILIKQKMCQIESQKINSVTDILTKIRKKENTVIHSLFVTVVKVQTFSKKHLNIRVHSRFEFLIGHLELRTCSPPKYATPARTLFISGLKSRVLKVPFFT